MASKPVSVLFVCLGNICRSPMAEGIFRSLTEASQSRITRIDSCGTAAYHTGSESDSRTMATLADRGITDYSHTARKVQPSDFTTFDYIFAMDQNNLSDLRTLQQSHGGEAKVMLFGEFSDEVEAEEIRDPYYGDRDGFEVAFEQCMRFSKTFLKGRLSETVLQA